MNTAFYIAFGICALIIGIFDFLFYRIPNLFVLVLIGLFLGLSLTLGDSKFFIAASITGTIALLSCYLLYVFGWLGAGDVKFIFAASLWASQVNSLIFFLSISLAGGILALIYINFSAYIDQARLFLISFLGKHFNKSQFFRRYSEAPFIYATAVPTKETKIPYGIAVAMGCLLVTYLTLFGHVI